MTLRLFIALLVLSSWAFAAAASERRLQIEIRNLGGQAAQVTVADEVCGDAVLYQGWVAAGSAVTVEACARATGSASVAVTQTLFGVETRMSYDNLPEGGSVSLY